MKKLSTLLSLIIMVLEKRFEESGLKGVLINGIRRKLLKYLKECVILFSGNSLLIIKWDWGKFFPKIDNWFIPTIKDKKATYFNPLLKVCAEKKYAIDLIPVKSYKKGFMFLMSLKLNYSLKLAKLFSQ